MDGSLEVVWRGLRCVVVDKPSGLLSVRGKGVGKEDCVPARVLGMFPWARGPMVVHRLDMDTSGLMVVALDADAQRDLSLQFERRKVFKRYVALLDGHGAVGGGASGGGDGAGVVGGDGWGVVDCAIRLDPENRPYQVHDPVDGRASRTRYRVVGRGWLLWGGVRRAVTRVEFEPLTGRSHQLRVHSAFGVEVGGLGRPIVGDPLYGVAGDRDGGGPRLMLHASELGFTEPGTDRWVVCRSAACWEPLVEACG